MKNLWIIGVGIVILFRAAAALGMGEVNKVGTTAANFLQMELGAKAIGLGGAFVGMADDASALYWNPAGMTISNRFRANFLTVNLYAGIKHQFAGVVIPLTKANTLGISANFISIGEMEITTIEKPEGTGQYFDAGDMALGASYAQQLTDRVSVGVTAKYIEERIWLESATGYALDFGSLYRIEDTGVQIGMAITNFGPSMSMNEGPHLSYIDEPPENYPGSPDRDVQLISKEFALPITFHMGAIWELVGPRSILKRDAKNKLVKSLIKKRKIITKKKKILQINYK